MSGKYFSYRSLLFCYDSNDFLMSGIKSTMPRIDWLMYDRYKLLDLLFHKEKKI